MGECTYPYSFESIMSIVTDPKYLFEISPLAEEIEHIDHLEDLTDVTYMKFKGMFIVSGRDFITASRRFETPDRKFLVLS
jgi:hypothetical protein